MRLIPSIKNLAAAKEDSVAKQEALGARSLCGAVFGSRWRVQLWEMCQHAN